MKKLVLFFVAVVAVSFASCGGAKTEQAPAADSAAVVEVEVATEAVVDTVTNDTLATDTVVAATVVAE
ncbi:MAG: hypothetical protein ACRCX4_10865 [Bacteroidales bacterium]